MSSQITGRCARTLSKNRSRQARIVWRKRRSKLQLRHFEPLGCVGCLEAFRGSGNLLRTWGKINGHCRPASQAVALSVQACVFRDIRLADRFRHLHEERPRLRSHIGDSATLRAGKVVPGAARLFRRPRHGVGRVPVLQPLAGALSGHSPNFGLPVCGERVRCCASCNSNDGEIRPVSGCGLERAIVRMDVDHGDRALLRAPRQRHAASPLDDSQLSLCHGLYRDADDHPASARIPGSAWPASKPSSGP